MLDNLARKGKNAAASLGHKPKPPQCPSQLIIILNSHCYRSVLLNQSISFKVYCEDDALNEEDWTDSGHRFRGLISGERVKRGRGLTKGEGRGRSAASYLSFASLLGVADVLESIVHHGHFDHLGCGFYANT